MLWLLYALLTALIHAVKDLLSKRLTRQVNPWLLAWAQELFAFLFMLPLLAWIPMPPIGPLFWPAAVASGLLLSAALGFYARALRDADLSLAAPILAFTPLFMLLTSPLLIGEAPTLLGAGGIVLIVAGSYLLNIDQRHLGRWAPLQALWTQPGARSMLITAFLFSFTANIDRIGMQNGSALAWMVAVTGVTAALMTPLAWLLARDDLGQVRRNLPALIRQGGLMAAVILFHMLAIEAGLVPYVIAVKRTSALMAVALGAWLLGESGLRRRFGGALIMFAGLLLIVLG
ncbi:DMT family transporter [Magnetofaba australis]|uniref:EamA domain-containing protein n=1 Tax=Magnetofaba australis IT-1 TaxID=1434232 RepID=A0A1Y2K853_9PROT|nr:DMT family transporter [Magnetofaba australis]OSM06913.1 hypothetical protein MAIT1_00203 [Magnetofaba australis IT-1]